VKEAGHIYRNPPRPLRRDLDEIPFPPRQLLYDYDDSLRLRPLKSFTTNRGCPSVQLLLQPVAGRPLRRQLEEGAHPQPRERRTRAGGGPFAGAAARDRLPREHLRLQHQLAARVRRALPPEIGLPYYCHVRGDMMTDEMVELLAWSGCHTVNLGIETANERPRQRRSAPADQDGQADRRHQAAEKAGIVVFAGQHRRHPGRIARRLTATLQLNIDLDVDYAAATLCTPVSRDGIAKYASTTGYFSGDFDLIDDSYYTSRCCNFSSADEKAPDRNLHKLFAVTGAIPALLPLTKQLIKLPPNDWFYSAFRAWYYICHVTDVMPRRPNLEQMKEGLLSIFGIYRGFDRNRFDLPPTEELPFHDADAGAPVRLGPARPREAGAHAP
jgi:hypothetical protein